MIKKFAYFIGLFISLIGAGCSLGWSIYLKQWGMLVGVIALVIAAFPTLRKWVDKLLGE